MCFCQTTPYVTRETTLLKIISKYFFYNSLYVSVYQ